MPRSLCATVRAAACWPQIVGVVELTICPVEPAASVNPRATASKGSDAPTRLTLKADFPFDQLSGVLGMNAEGKGCHDAGGVNGMAPASARADDGGIVPRSKAANAATRTLLCEL
jgi:hypothetical protein